MPPRQYFFRFVNGEMTADYAPEKNGKWHLRKLCHQFTNNFFFAIYGNFAFKATESSELYCDSTSRYVGEDIVKKFYPGSFLAYRRYTYDKRYWETISYPFCFARKDALYHDLERDGSLDRQFEAEGKKE